MSAENRDKEEFEDLFGDEEEDVVQEKTEVENGANDQLDENIDDDLGLGVDDDDDHDNDDDDEEHAAEGEEVAEEVKEADMTLERHPRSHIPYQEDAYSFPLPRFLYVDPTPFTPNVFEQQVKDFLKTTQSDDVDSSSLKSSIQFKKLQLANTIRWRYAKDSNNQLYKQSNSNIVEWEDGSMSLKLGNDYFDIKLKNNDDNLLAFKNNNNQTLMSFKNLNKSVQILPPSMKSRAHLILANTLTKNMKLKKSKTINTIVTNEDPELKAKEVTRVQKEIEKARRRQEAKLQLLQEQSERSGSGNGRGPSRFRQYDDEDDIGFDDDDIDVGEDYDDEDDGGASGERGGFIVDDNDEGSELDDDELDKAAERLKRVKREGAAKYKAEIEDDEEEGEADEEDEDGTVVRKKRKIVVEDEDDE